MLAALVFQYPQALPWVILLEIVLTGLILILYPRQLDLAQRWTLRALRILAVTAIAFSILRPVITRARLPAERAPIVILLDNSRSMSVVDSGRAPAEWVGIAAAMGLLSADWLDTNVNAVQGACDRLSAQADELVRARAELDYARLSARGTDVARARLDQTVGDLQSIARDAAAKAAMLLRATQLEKTLAYLKQIPVGIDRETWLDHVRDKARAAALNAEQLRFASDADLYQADAKIRDACLPLESKSRFALSNQAIHGLIDRLGETAPVLQFALSDRVVARGPSPVAADSTINNLTGGVRAVVLFSDGRQVGDAETIPQGVPIYTVGVAARGGRTPRPATRPTAQAEIGDLPGDEGRLRRLAESSGGQFFRMDQLDLLPTKLSKIPDDLVHPVEISLWDGPYLYCLVLGCLTSEWGLRKKFGLA